MPTEIPHPLHDTTRATLQTGQNGADSRLPQSVQARFADAEQVLLKAIGDVVRAEIAREKRGGALGGGQGGFKGADTGEGSNVNSDSELDNLSTRVATLETQILSTIQKDQEFRTSLERRLKSLETLMEAILSETPQGKRFVAKNFQLDPIKYQEASRRNEAELRKEFSRLSQGWRQRTEMQKREFENDGKRNMRRLARLGREVIRAEREYVDAMARRGVTEKLRFEASQGDEQRGVGDDSPSATEGHIVHDQYQTEWESDQDMTGDGTYMGEMGQSGEAMECDGGVDEQIEGGEQSSEVEKYWKRYERQGQTNNPPLSLTDVCWPMFVDPLTLTNIEQLYQALGDFILSPLHSQDIPLKKRINITLLRWHPDKGAWLLREFQNEEEKALAMEIVTAVASCLLVMRKGL